MTILRRRAVPQEAGIFVVLLVMIAAFAFMSPTFFTVSNGLVLLLNGSVIALLALGQTFVLLTGGIDLSTGACVAMTGVLAALVMSMGVPWPLAFLIGVGAGVLLGVVNGSLIRGLGLPPFIVTFATLGVASSIPLIISGANSINVEDPGFAVIGQGSLLGIPVPIWIVAAVALAGSFLLRRTVFGVHVYAVGGSSAAARLAGVRITRVTITVYALSGACAALGGMITTSRLNVGYPSTGQGNLLFYSIAAAVVGGVSLFGGVGTITGALLGAVLIATVSNGMNVIGVDSYWQPLVIGLIILGGVALDARRKLITRGRSSRRQPGPGSTPSASADVATSETSARVSEQPTPSG